MMGEREGKGDGVEVGGQQLGSGHAVKMMMMMMMMMVMVMVMLMMMMMMMTVMMMIFVMIVHMGGKPDLLPVLVSPSADDACALHNLLAVAGVRDRVKGKGGNRNWLLEH